MTHPLIVIQSLRKKPPQYHTQLCLEIPVNIALIYTDITLLYILFNFCPVTKLNSVLSVVSAMNVRNRRPIKSDWLTFY